MLKCPGSLKRMLSYLPEKRFSMMKHFKRHSCYWLSCHNRSSSVINVFNVLLVENSSTARAFLNGRCQSITTRLEFCGITQKLLFKRWKSGASVTFTTALIPLSRSWKSGDNGHKRPRWHWSSLTTNNSQRCGTCVRCPPYARVYAWVYASTCACLMPHTSTEHVLHRYVLASNTSCWKWSRHVAIILLRGRPRHIFTYLTHRVYSGPGAAKPNLIRSRSTSTMQ